MSWWQGEANASDGFGLNHGSLGGSLGFAAGEVGQAFFFTAAGQEVSIPASASLNVGAGAGLTIEAWINPADTATQYPLAEFNDGASLGAHFWINVSYAGYGGPASLYAAVQSGNTALIVAVSNVVTAGVWQHVAFTYDRASGFERLYLNGVEVASRNVGNLAAQTALPLHLGHRPLADTFRGLLDEVSLYNRALTAAEIQSIYSAGPGGKCRVTPLSGVTFLSEGFEGAFPNAAWSVGDANPTGTPATWDDVNWNFGGEGAHSGNWKGYCAGSTYPFGSSEPNPTYQTYMQAYLQTASAYSVLGYSAVQLTFWYKIPSIETCCDSFRVYFNGFFGSHLLMQTGTPINSWTPVSLNLTGLDPINGTVRFEFDSDLSVVAEGAYLDDISIVGSVTPPGESIQSLALVNNLGAVLDADTLSSAPGHDREFITAESVVRSSNPTGSPANYSYTLVYRLLDASGTPFPILDSTGVTNSGYTCNVTNTVALPAFTQMDGDARTALRPAATLSPTNFYTVELRVQRNGLFTATATNGPLQFFHFTNTVSGDPSLNVLGRMDSVSLSRAWAISNSPGQSAFAVNVAATVARYDDFNLPASSASVPFVFNCQLIDTSTGLPVPLKSPQTTVNVSLASHSGGVLPGPVTQAINTPLLLEPSGVQLDPVDKTYKIVVSLSHAESSTVYDHGSLSTAPARLFHFDSRLLFGSILTYFTNLNSLPVVSNVVAGDHLDIGLPVSPDAGYLPLAPGHTFGDGSFMPVSFFKNGDCRVKSGYTITVHGPSPDVDCIQNICFTRSSVVLSNDLLKAFVVLKLPLGFSVGISPSNHFTIPGLEYPNTPLDASLHPTDAVLVTPGPLYGVEETLPYWFAAPNLRWHVSAGQITLDVTGGVFVRQDVDDYLTSQRATLVETNTANRISNDGYLRNAAPGSQFTVVADANGVARIATQLTLSPPELRPHFPFASNAPGYQITTAPGGVLTINDGLVDPSNSFLNVSGPVPAAYGRDCVNIGCTAAGVGPAMLAFTPATSGKLGFTPDGGLLAYGSVPSSDLKWGFASGTDFAQRALNVTAGAFCMAGTFLRSDQTALDDSERAAVVLFTGFGDASNPAYFERPADANYPRGFANYAGLNFRSPSTGRSYLAKTDTGNYPLHPVSKYYVRAGGVSGIHQASSFPGALPLYGYNFTFTSYGLSYLDGENWESRTDGAITFPTQPAGFTQPFDNMLLTCRGDLQSAQIPANSGTNHLNYWATDFVPLSMDFHPTNNDVCGTGNRFLVLGAQMKLPFIPQSLQASLGFKPNGNFVTPADNVTNVDSRFRVPAQLSLQGPGATFFPLATANTGYFNNWETPGRPDAGFYNLAGKVRVPFFSDIKLHLHVTPLSATTASIDVMGGWPAADSTAADLGWSVNTSNYFNQVDFDPTSDGWPHALGVALNDYRNATTPDGKYHPRAQRDWIEVAFFDYPLVWNPALHSFAGFGTAKVILPVIDVDSRLKELSPGKVDFDFAQDINLQLPQIKVLDFVNDALNGNIGPLLSVSNAIRGALGSALDVTGLNELSQALREDAQQFFNPVLDSVLDPALNPSIDALYSQIAAQSQADKAAFLNSVYQIVNAPAGALPNAISSINGAAGNVNSVVGSLDKTLTDVQKTVAQFNGVLARDNNGHRHVVSAIIQQLAHDQGPALGFVTTLTDTQIQPLLADLEPTLAEIQSELGDISNQLAQVHTALTAGSGDFNQALSSVIGATGLSPLLKSAATDVTNYLASAITPAGDFFTANPAAARQAIRKQIETAFLASALPANYQQTVKGFLYDKDFLLNQLMATLFDQINNTIRNALTTFISNAQDGIFQNMKGAGLLGGSLLAAKITGAPTFDGDSLRDIHLNAAVKMNLPDEMNFTAYMDIKELDSQSVPVDCIPAGAPAAEVTLGAKDIPLDWAGLSPTPGSKLTLTVEARWTLQGGAVLGIGGLFDIKGEVGFKGCTIKEIGATLAIGQLENYFAAKAAGTIIILGIPVDLHVGLFAGHACTLDPLKFIDPEAGQVLNDPAGFSGIYIEYGGGLSLSEILFGTSSCLLDVEASETTAIYYMGGPRLGTLGGRQKMAVDVSLLCLISGHVDWAVFIQLTAGQLTLGASANVCGSIGPCPFCIEGCKGITVKGVLTTGGIDYSIDY